MLKSGLYVAENNDSVYDAYRIKMLVKETRKSYTFELVEFFSHYSAAHIKMLFQGTKRFLLKKGEGPHAIRCLSDDSFDFYPYQAGTPYSFHLVSDKPDVKANDTVNDRTKKAFERFKLKWMLDHGYTLTDLIECMEVMIHEDEQDGFHTKLTELFARWEFGVGFVDGSVWPCYEEFLQNEALESGERFLLISVCERDITTEVFPSLEEARKQMMDELKDEFSKGNKPSEWKKYEDLPQHECGDFCFTETTAWSNLDDDNNCDWLIIPIGHK